MKDILDVNIYLSHSLKSEIVVKVRILTSLLNGQNTRQINSDWFHVLLLFTLVKNLTEASIQVEFLENSEKHVFYISTIST